MSSPRQIHVTYAVPSDAPDRFPARANQIASDAATIDTWWQSQDPVRTPRFDLFPFPGCGSRFGLLDIGFARLAHDSSYYQGRGGGPEDRGYRIAAELAGVAPPDVKNLVYYDGPMTDANRRTCGESDYRAPHHGGEYGFAFVWLQACLGITNPAWTASVAAHELLHNFGGVPAGAPHECPETHAHACDSSRDVLYPYIGVGYVVLDQAILDANRDDYYAHSGTWWDVQDSDWLTHLPQRTLAVSVSGPGEVRGTPGVITCPGTCSALLDDGLVVSLQALAGADARFAGWSGACSGSGACRVTLDQTKTVGAAFGPSTYPLAVTIRGRGKVTSMPEGIACPGRCSDRFLVDDDLVQLRAKAAKGYRFGSWSGGCTGKGACVLPIRDAMQVTVTFVRKPKRR